MLEIVLFKKLANYRHEIDSMEKKLSLLDEGDEAMSLLIDCDSLHTKYEELYAIVQEAKLENEFESYCKVA